MTRYPWLRRLAIGIAIGIGFVVALLVLLLLAQPTLKLSPFKGRLEAQLTGLAGVPVTLEELYLKTSLEPSVEIRELRVADLAGVGTTRLQIELLPLLKRRISIESLRLDRVTLQARPALELAKEWLEEDDRPKSPYRVDALETLELDRVQVNVTDTQGVARRFVIDELDGGITRKSPLKLEARGSLDDAALRFEAEGPTLEDLFDPASTLPLVAAFEIAGTRLSAEGTLTERTGQPVLALDFGLEGDDLQATLAVAKIGVPPLGPFGLSGRLDHSGGPIRISDLEGQVGGASLSGDLQLSLETERPGLEGTLAASRIDLRPWLEPAPAEDDPGNEEAEPDQSLLDQPLPAELVERVLTAFDADLDVTIGGLDGLPTAVEELTADVSIQGSRLNLPFELRLGSAPVEGLLEVAGTQGFLELALDLSSSTLPLDRLTDDLGQGLVTGTVGQVRLAASSTGATVGDLINQVAFHLETGDAQIRFRSPNADKKVDLVLTHMEARRSPEAPLQALVDGDLRGYPYHIELKAQATKDWRSHDPWPFTLTAEGLGGRTKIEGHLSPEPGDLSLDLEVFSSGDRIGDLEPWWGVPADADYPYALHGHLSVEADRLELNLDDLRIGQTAATMTLLDPPEEEAPLQVDVQVSMMVLDELMHLIDIEDKEIATKPLLTVDIPIFPGELTLPDATVHVELDQVLRDSEKLADLSEVVADVAVLQGHLERITFSARADEASFRGRSDFDWQADPPTMSLDLAGEALDLGRLVPLDEVAPGLVVRARRFDLRVTGAERTLRQMLDEGVTITGGAENVFLSVPSLDKEIPLELTLDQAKITESPDRPLQFSADGHLREWPVDLRLVMDSKNRTDLDDDQVPVELVLNLGDVRFETSTVLEIPFTPDNIDLDFSLEADRISSFEAVLGHRISEVGPVAATGDLAIRPDSFTLQDLSLEVGQSDARGNLSLDLAGSKPRLSADLSSQRVHLAEILAHTSTPDEDPSQSVEEPTQPPEASDEAEEESWLEKLQSSQLAGLELDLNLQSQDIYWGGETGGGGLLRIRSEEGRLEVGPFQLALADGSIEGHVMARDDSGLLDADMELQVYDVEYGPIVKYLDPESDTEGRIDLETRLVSTRAPLDQLITVAEGDLRFAIFPSNVDTKLLNLWGAGLFRSMFSVVDPTDESVLNCMVGDFSIADGRMTVDDFWFDTSRVRARGKGSVDLDTMTVDMTLRPRPKKRTFLTLATPAKIKGPVEDPSITLSKGGLVGTAFRIYMWVLTLYAQILKRPLPTDGSDVCFLPPPPETVEAPTSEATQPPGR